jgi:flagellar hook assembly protein FlgD
LFPNPFNPKTILKMKVPEMGKVSIHIFDITGRKVRLIETGIFQVGKVEISWDGKNMGGEKLASGLYIFKPILKTLDSQILIGKSIKGVLVK